MPKHMSRDGAGRFNLPAGATGSINTLLPIGNQLEIYTEDCTVLSLGPNSTDPDRTNPDARWQNSVLVKMGSSHPAIARTILMAAEMLQQSLLNKNVSEEKILFAVHAVKENLVSLSLAVNDLVGEINQELNLLRSSSFKLDEGGVALAFFPSVKNLNGKLTNILTLGKRVIVGVGGVFNAFGVTAKAHARFDHLIKEAAGNDTASEWFKNYLAEVLPGGERIGHLRDAQEHGQAHKLKVKNFHALPNNDVSVPLINLDDTGWVTLESEVDQIQEFLIGLTECCFIGCLEQVLSKDFSFSFVVVENPPLNKPIKYKLSLNFVVPSNER